MICTCWKKKMVQNDDDHAAHAANNAPTQHFVVGAKIGSGARFIAWGVVGSPVLLLTEECIYHLEKAMAGKQ